MNIGYVQDLLREWSNQGVVITLRWDEANHYFVAEAKYEMGDMVDARGSTLEDALTKLDELCQEWLSEYDND